MSPPIRRAMGLDIGGSGVKAAIVDIDSGELASERVRLKTPRPATPDAVLKVVGRIREELDWQGPVGCGFPGTFRGGRLIGAPNLDPAWIGRDLAEGLLCRAGHAFEKATDWHQRKPPV